MSVSRASRRKNVCKKMTGSSRDSIINILAPLRELPDHEKDEYCDKHTRGVPGRLTRELCVSVRMSNVCGGTDADGAIVEPDNSYAQAIQTLKNIEAALIRAGTNLRMWFGSGYTW